MRYCKIVCMITLFVVMAGIQPVLAVEWMEVTPVMSDESFFGVWNESTGWETEGKINYDYDSALSEVEQHVKNKDYLMAKEALFTYYKNKEFPYSSAPDRAPLDGLFACENIFAENNQEALNVFTLSGDEWQRAIVDVTPLAQAKTTIGIQLMAMNKDTVDIEVSGKHGIYVPTLSLLADGEYRSYEPIRDSYITPNATVENPETLLIRESGIPYDDNSKRAFITFDISDIPGTADITAATISLYAKPNRDGETTVIVWKDLVPDVVPQWSTHVKNIYSWQGATCEELNWAAPKGSDNEFQYLWSRFYFFSDLVGEYFHTQDEYYAENAIRLLLNFYYHKGKESDNGGGWPRSLDAGMRLNTISKKLMFLHNSEHMTAEIYTEALKNIWVTTNFLAKDSNFHANNNWGMTETRGLFASVVFYPEFKQHDEWLQLGVKRMNNMLENRFVLNDGSYIEASSMYTNATLGSLLGVLTCFDDEMVFEEDFFADVDELSEYYMNLFTPSGEEVRWGDADSVVGSDIRSTSGTLGQLQQYTNNQYLLYFLTKGTQGKIPPYTSRLYAAKNMAILRSGWTDDDLYLMTEADGGLGGHQHPDDLAIVMAAYGKTLLTDQGRYSYSSDTISNFVSDTTEAHNTITINDKAQSSSSSGIEGNKTEFFITSEELDFYQGLTKSYSGFDHTRAITFVKPNYFIVSDYVQPANKQQENKYSQNWHSSVDFKLDENGTTGRTTFDDGVNLQIVQADTSGMTIGLKKGYFSPEYSKASAVNYLAAEKTQAGDVMYDTVLYPQRGTDVSDVSAVKLPLASDVKGTAMKITFDDQKNTSEDYYYLSYATDGIYSYTSFDKYSFNGKVAVLENDSRGKTISASIADGSILQENGMDLIRSDTPLDCMTVEWSNCSIEVTRSETAQTANQLVKIYAPQQLAWVTVDGESIPYERVDDYIVIGG